jgi:hypothetical protein
MRHREAQMGDARLEVIPEACHCAVMLGSVQNLSHFRLAERHPALAHAMVAPLICWSFSNSMFRYLLVDHAVPAMDNVQYLSHFQDLRLLLDEGASDE